MTVDKHFILVCIWYPSITFLLKYGLIFYVTWCQIILTKIRCDSIFYLYIVAANKLTLFLVKATKLRNKNCYNETWLDYSIIGAFSINHEQKIP